MISALDETWRLVQISFEPGMVIMHRGQHKHEALPLTSGERVNLVVWLFAVDGACLGFRLLNDPSADFGPGGAASSSYLNSRMLTPPGLQGLCGSRRTHQMSSIRRPKSGGRPIPPPRCEPIVCVVKTTCSCVSEPLLQEEPSSARGPGQRCSADPTRPALPVVLSPR